MQAVIGVDVGGTNTSGGLALEDGTLIEKIRRATDRSGGAAAGYTKISGIIAELSSIAASRKVPLRRIGVGFGGPVDFDGGRVILSHHVAGWEGVPLRDRLEQDFQTPVVLDNDANAGTLGEWKFGAGRGVNNLLYVNIGTGIGGGVIANGSLVRGAANLAGEIGHITVVRDGDPCTCGRRGCLESCASGDAIARRGSRALGRDLKGRDLFALADMGDQTALGVISAVIEDLAQGLGTAVNLLNPAAIIIGGGLSEAPTSLFLEPLRKAVPRYCLGPAGANLRIDAATLRYDAGIMGAVALALSSG